MKKSQTVTPTRISTADLRRSLGEICDRVQYTGESVIVNRKGREIVAIVPVEMVRLANEAIRKERGRALMDLVSVLDNIEDKSVSDEKAMAVANAAVAEVRKAKSGRK